MQCHVVILVLFVVLVDLVGVVYWLEQGCHFSRACSRPFVFFESASDLMGKYWSGAVGERATALQVSFIATFSSIFCDFLRLFL